MHDGHAARLQAVENRHDLGPGGPVQHGGRLVEHDHRRMHRHRARDGDALLLAAAHHRRIRGSRLGHVDRLQSLGDAPADVVMRDAEVLRAERHIVLDHRGDELVLGILEHRADAAARPAVGIRIRPGIAVEHPFAQHRDGARVRGRKPGDDPRQRGLPRTVRADDAHALAGPNGQIHAVQRPGHPVVVAETDAAQRHGDVVGRLHGHRSSGHRLSRFEIGL